MRKGMMKGKGKGYKNVIGKDPIVHSMSSKGIKQPQRVSLIMLNVPKRNSYIYDSNFVLDGFGTYNIYSRDGERYFLDGGNNAKLLLLPDTPFKNPTEAKNYLKERAKRNDIFGVKIKNNR